MEVASNATSYILSFLCDLAECPDGYDLSPGDIPGFGTLFGTKEENVATVADCGDKCDSHSDCWSIEYSASRKICNLNKERLPTAEAYRDFIFCSKGNIDR